MEIILNEVRLRGSSLINATLFVFKTHLYHSLGLVLLGDHLLAKAHLWFCHQSKHTVIFFLYCFSDNKDSIQFVFLNKADFHRNFKRSKFGFWVLPGLDLGDFAIHCAPEIKSKYEEKHKNLKMRICKNAQSIEILRYLWKHFLLDENTLTATVGPPRLRGLSTIALLPT